MAKTVIVVGAGLAGLRACERLRGAGFDGRLLVIGEEAHPPYNRPPLTKQFLRGSVPAEKLAFPQRDVTADVEWWLDTRAVSVDLAGHRVRLGDGAVMSYDGLVVATGVRSRTLGLDIDPARRHAIRTIGDAQRLAGELTMGARVVIVGAGFIGSEVAATAVSLGCDVTVVEPRSTPLEVPLGPILGAEVRRRHESHGVRFALGHTVQTVKAAGGKPELVLSNGDRLVADVVVEAVGSVGNVEPLDGQGLDLSNGVLCDRLLHPLRDGVTVADVVVTGDVTRFPIAGFGEDPMRVEHWTMPTDMAPHAAASLLAGMNGEQAPTEPFAPLPTFWSELYGVRLQTFGVPHLGLGDVRVLEGDLQDEAAVGYHRDGQLMGVVLIGVSRRMPEYRSAVVTAQRSRILELAR